MQIESQRFANVFLPSQFLKSMTPQWCWVLWWTVGPERWCWWSDWAFLVQLHFWLGEDIPAEKTSNISDLDSQKLVSCYTESMIRLSNYKLPGLTGRLQGLPFTFTHRLGGKWSSWGQLVSDKQNLKRKKINDRSSNVKDKCKKLI